MGYTVHPFDANFAQRGVERNYHVLLRTSPSRQTQVLLDRAMLYVDTSGLLSLS